MKWFKGRPDRFQEAQRGTLVAVQFLVFALALMILALVSACTHLHEGEASWAIQGEYSHLGCPRQYVETVEVDDHVYFLGCYGSKESK